MKSVMKKTLSKSDGSKLHAKHEKHLLEKPKAMKSSLKAAKAKKKDCY